MPSAKKSAPSTATAKKAAPRAGGAGVSNPQKTGNARGNSAGNKGRGNTPPARVGPESAATAGFLQTPSGRYLNNKTGNKANMGPTRTTPSKASRSARPSTARKPH
jgi:hypothetical protein